MVVWGLLDLACLTWYIVAQFFERQLPFFDDLMKSAKTAQALGSSLPVYLATAS